VNVAILATGSPHSWQDVAVCMDMVEVDPDILEEDSMAADLEVGLQ
jgi:hypothetical protein